ncbi:MAG: peptide chain release factor N(5)-glutamine methyltransferase [Ruminococcus sp.]|nr:peptide chain release factor N(5)-glutamine methyltransferase [Ruminococcus sp.]
MSTYGQLVTDAVRELSSLEYSDAALEAKELMGAVLRLDCRCVEFSDKLWQEADDSSEQQYYELCKRRMSGEPLQYILGEWDFCGITFKLGEGVLIPRLDTETLVDAAIKLFGDRSGMEIIDLCAGTGCIGLVLEKKLDNVSLTLVEKYADAMQYLLENKLRLGSSARVVKGDVCDEKLPPQQPKADLIVCNPPYLTAKDMKAMQPEVSFEPVEALYGGEDGLDFYRTVIRLWKDSLKDGGAMLFEIGAAQADEVMQMLIQHGFRDVRSRKDLCGNDRMVIGWKKED